MTAHRQPPVDVPDDVPGDVPGDEPVQAPVAALLGAVEGVAADWLRRCVIQTAQRQLGACPAELEALADEMAAREAPVLVDRIAALLATDVDEQRAGPLSVFRSAVLAPGAVLAAARVPPVARDDFHLRSFPDDHYGLSPAAWSDVDPRLHEPGIEWGAWKAATVLRRRRAEGCR